MLVICNTRTYANRDTDGGVDVAGNNNKKPACENERAIQAACSSWRLELETPKRGEPIDISTHTSSE